MHTEIEVKLKVEALEPVAQSLAQLDAVFVDKLYLRDYYFDDVDRTLTRTDRGLRLRHQRIQRGRRVFLSYKGPKQPANVKKRPEIEIEVSDGAAAAELLAVLGYEQSLVVEKTRRLWRLGQCEVALDKLQTLGSFIEIEGPNERAIRLVQQQLGLSDLTHIRQSYADLVAGQMGPDRHSNTAGKARKDGYET